MAIYSITIRHPDGTSLWRSLAWSKKEKDETVSKLLNSFRTGEGLTQWGEVIREEVLKGRPFKIRVQWPYRGAIKVEEYDLWRFMKYGAKN